MLSSLKDALQIDETSVAFDKIAIDFWRYLSGLKKACTVNGSNLAVRR
jgi:hypothetical protein